jgi:uncharacterized membrane protein
LARALQHFNDPSIDTSAFWLIVAGLIGGVLAAPFGLVEWLAIPAGTRAKRIGALHGIGNVVVLLLFLASLMLRLDDAQNPGTLAYICSFAAVGLALITGWLGGELVARLGVGVDDAASVNAPSSLHAVHATGTAAATRSR